MDPNGNGYLSLAEVDKGIIDTFQVNGGDRFATKREIEELKKLAADASALFPAEFRSAEPSAVRMLFKRREAEKSAALVAAS